MIYTYINRYIDTTFDTSYDFDQGSMTAFHGVYRKPYFCLSILSHEWQIGDCLELAVSTDQHELEIDIENLRIVYEVRLLHVCCGSIYLSI